jgi:hypothetical protein
MRFSFEREEAGPSHWIIIDPRPPGYIGQEIVDLSRGAIELRQAARELRAYAERREHWIELRELEADPASGGARRQATGDTGDGR